MRKASKDHRVYLSDILSAIERIEEYKKKGREEFLHDGLLQDGIIRQVSIIGEAATKLPSGWKTQHTEIPWKMITAMRNILIHDYSEINLERVWIVVEEELPRLRATVEIMLRDLNK